MAFLQVSFYSEALELNMEMQVILPQRPCPCPGGKWPTLYLLHGLMGDHTSWQRRTSIERYVEDMDLAVVMPAVHRSFYTDMAHGMRFWTFISEELPALCERMFPLSGERSARFAAGLSMGGYGALKLGLLCPERYAAVASLSGAVDMAARQHFGQSASMEKFYRDIFGSPEAMDGSDNDLVAVADRLIKAGKQPPKIYLACGTEDYLYRMNVEYKERFGDALGITYEEGPGDHTWDFWDAYIRRVLRWLPL